MVSPLFCNGPENGTNLRLLTPRLVHSSHSALDTILELQDSMLFHVAVLPDDLGIVARNWVERFVILLDVFVFEEVFDEHFILE